MSWRPRDAYLEMLLEPYIKDSGSGDPETASFLSHLTLLVDGTVVSGRPISARHYFERTRQQVTTALKDSTMSPDEASKLTDVYDWVFDKLKSSSKAESEALTSLEQAYEEQFLEGERYSEEQEAELEKHRSLFLHLEDVVVFTGTQSMFSELFRVRLSDINGWALGQAGGKE